MVIELSEERRLRVEASLAKKRRLQAHTRRKLGDSRARSDPSLRRITENIRVKRGFAVLVCPLCGEVDRNNRMNGVPWCFKCNVALISSDEKGEKQVIRQGSLEGVKRRLRGLPEQDD